MATGGRVLVVERLIPDDPAAALPVLLNDMNMLVFTGGKERTNAEYGKLLTDAGLNPGRVQPFAAASAPRPSWLRRTKASPSDPSSEAEDGVPWRPRVSPIGPADYPVQSLG